MYEYIWEAVTHFRIMFLVLQNRMTEINCLICRHSYRAIQLKVMGKSIFFDLSVTTKVSSLEGRLKMFLAIVLRPLYTPTHLLYPGSGPATATTQLNNVYIISIILYYFNVIVYYYCYIVKVLQRFHSVA